MSDNESNLESNQDLNERSKMSEKFTGLDMIDEIMKSSNPLGGIELTVQKHPTSVVKKRPYQDVSIGSNRMLIVQRVQKTQEGKSAEIPMIFEVFWRGPPGILIQPFVRDRVESKYSTVFLGTQDIRDCVGATGRILFEDKTKQFGLLSVSHHWKDGLPPLYDYAKKKYPAEANYVYSLYTSYLSTGKRDPRIEAYSITWMIRLMRDVVKLFKLSDYSLVHFDNFNKIKVVEEEGEEKLELLELALVANRERKQGEKVEGQSRIRFLREVILKSLGEPKKEEFCKKSFVVGYYLYPFIGPKVSRKEREHIGGPKRGIMGKKKGKKKARSKIIEDEGEVEEFYSVTRISGYEKEKAKREKREYVPPEEERRKTWDKMILASEKEGLEEIERVKKHMRKKLHRDRKSEAENERLYKQWESYRGLSVSSNVYISLTDAVVELFDGTSHKSNSRIYRKNETDVTPRLGALMRNMNDHTQFLYNEIQEVKKEVRNVDEKVDNLNRTLTNSIQSLTTTVGTLATSVNTMQTMLTNLDNRFTRIEQRLNRQDEEQ